METDLETGTKRKTGLRRITEVAGTKKWWLFASIFFAIISTALQFVPIVVVYLILVELAQHATNLALLNQEYMFNLAWISVFSVVGYALLLYISTMLSHIAAFNILYEIRVRISDKLTRLSMGFFTEKSSGEIKKVMSDDVERLELYIAHHIPDITSGIAFPLILIGFLIVADWLLGIVTLIPLIVGILVQAKMTSETELYNEYHDSLQDINTAVVEYVRGMPVIKVFGATAESFASLRKTTYAFRDLSKMVTEKYSTVYPRFLTAISSSLLLIIPVATFLLTLYPYDQYIPMVLLFLIVGGGMFFPLLKLMTVSSKIKEIGIGMERIDGILDREEMMEVSLGKHPADASIAFEEVSFAYEDDITLSDVSFSAEPGTVTALVGPSGSGKTTIGLLTARFWDVLDGAIKIGGVDVRDMKIAELMDYVSFVFQESFLFFDTIEENIRIGNRSATKEEVIDAAKAAQCHEFIEALPDGYDTLIGEGGTYLSGGETQRLAIARLILKDTPIVVLDEATAFADPENESKILKAFNQLINEKTVIVIAHRLSTVVNADQILVVDNGQIVQRGQHEDLVALDGLYRNMWDHFNRSRDWKIQTRGVVS
jgi:ATP-binding cassette subfamily B protein